MTTPNPLPLVGDREALISAIMERGGRWVDRDDAEHILDAILATLRPTDLQAENERLREALNPFAAMGRVLEARARVTFGENLPDGKIICDSVGEVGMGILTMGHFRDAAALLPKAPGWGGMYRPPFDRLALNPESSQ